MKILMTGATGWVGQTLGIELVRKGHQLVCLVRDPLAAKEKCPFPAEWVRWSSVSDSLDDAAFEGVDAVLHLLGEPVAGARWTPEIKSRILSSRIESTRTLADKVRQHKIPVFVSASAIGFYGDRAEDELNELSAPGSGFLPEVCVKWEEELFRVEDVSRCVAVRIGIVLGRDGGALEKMLPPFQMGAGGPMGSGQQWMSWIHIEDLQQLILKSLEDSSFRGPINATSPQPVRQKDFAVTLGQVLGRPAVVPAPKAALMLMLGEMAQVVLASQKVLPERALAAGFQFKHTDLHAALSSILAPEQAGEHLFTTLQFVPQPLEKVFPFYADEMNLERITPPFLEFKVLGKNTSAIEEGTLIDYQLKLYGIPFKWRTKILDWKPPLVFVDTQLSGPYALWHHTHLFESLGGGTLITDRVRYKIPAGLAGSLVAGWKVHRDVKRIFDFRRKVIAQDI